MLQPGGGATSIGAGIVKSYGAPNASVLDLEFDVRLDVASADGLTGVDLANWIVGDPNGTHMTIDWHVYPNGTSGVFTQVSTQTPQSFFGPTGGPSLDQWTHLDFRISSGSPYNLVVWQDGNNIASIPLFSGPFASQGSIILGLIYVQTMSKPWRVEFDNVVLH